MNTVDFIIIAVLGLSVMVGLLRGFISEVWALFCWICAGWLAWYCGPFVEARLPQDWATPGVRLVAAYVACFVLVIIVGAIIGYLLRRMVSSSGLSGTDRLLGLVFGLARGVAVIVLIVLMLGFTPFHRDAWWQESRLLPTFEGVAEQVKAYLPMGLSNYLRPAEQMPVTADQTTPAKAGQAAQHPAQGSPNPELRDPPKRPAH